MSAVAILTAPSDEEQYGADFVPPRFGTKRNYDRETLGPELAEQGRRLGKPFMPWQRYAADVSQEIDPDTGDLWYEEVVITVPRQSGKTTLIVALLVWRCLVFALAVGPQTCSYIAQSLKMARRKLEREFARLMRSCKSLSEIPRMAKAHPSRDDEWKLSMNNGSEHIVFGVESYLQIEAPTELSSHGDVLDVSVTDEAWAREDDAVEEATDAATVTRRSPQSWIVSTAGNKRSKYLARKVLAGRRSVDDPKSRTCYLEWSLADDEDYTDPDVWRRRLPALGHTITVERLQARLAKAQRNPDEVEENGYEPGIAGFRRGYMNQWPEWPDFQTAPKDGPVDLEVWAALGEPGSLPDDDTVKVCIDAPPSGRSAVFGLAGRRADGRLHVQIRHLVRPSGPEDQSLRDQVVAVALELTKGHKAKLILPPGSPAERWEPDLVAAKVPLDRMTRAEYIAACGRIVEAVEVAELVHRNQDELNVAVAGLAARVSGDNEAWSRRSSSSDISPFITVTCAAARVPEPRSRSAYEESGLTVA